MDSEARTPTLDEMFAGMPNGNGQQGAQPKYTEYAQRFKSMAATHRPRMIVPAILIVAVVLLFGGVGAYMVRNMENVPAAPMSAAQAFQSAQGAPAPQQPAQAAQQPTQAAQTVRVGYAGATAVGRTVTPAEAAVVYELEITTDGQQRYQYQGRYYCTDARHSIESLWLFAHDIETKDDTFRGMYTCQ